MIPCHWSEGVFASFDLETTGVDPQKDRIVSVALLMMTPAGAVLPGSLYTLVDAGVEIPGGATAIHGITRSRVLAEGIPMRQALARILYTLDFLRRMGWPLVIYNACYDWPLLLAECRRMAEVEPERPWTPRPVPILDPLVLDRRLRPGKGSRKLVDVSAYYRVELDNAHDAASDAIAAVGVLRAQVERYQILRDLDLDELQGYQVESYQIWRDDFNGYLRRKGRAVITEEWPGAPLLEAVPA